MELTDTQLVARTLKGSQEAFAALVRCHQNYAYGTAIGLLSDFELAQEVVQESFLTNNEHIYRITTTTHARQSAPLGPLLREGISEKDYSRIGSLPGNYQAAYLALIEHYQQANELKKAGRVLAVMRDALPEDLLPMDPGLSTWLEWLGTEIARLS